MKLLRRRHINTLLATFAAAILLYFVLHYSETGSPDVFSDPPEINRQAEFYINNTRITEFNDQGMLNAIIESEHIEQNPEKKSIDMVSPRINIFNLGIPGWTITAAIGAIYDNGNSVDLEQQVIATSSDRLTLLKTPQLLVFPNKKIVKTDRPVTLISVNGVTRAEGLTADLNARQIDLLSKVRGQYEPKALSDYVD